MANKPLAKQQRRKRKRIHRVSKSQNVQIVELQSITAHKIDALPPNDNLSKHPDEAYGDTEIPERGKLLDDLKRLSKGSGAG